MKLSFHLIESSAVTDLEIPGVTRDLPLLKRKKTQIESDYQAPWQGTSVS